MPSTGTIRIQPFRDDRPSLFDLDLTFLSDVDANQLYHTPDCAFITDTGKDLHVTNDTIAREVHEEVVTELHETCLRRYVQEDVPQQKGLFHP